MKNNYRLVMASAATAFLVVGSVLPVMGKELESSSQTETVHRSADDTASSSVITRAEDRAHQEILRRTTVLDSLTNRLKEMEHISGDDKNGLLQKLQTQITGMRDLGTKIDNDANEHSTSSLKEDIKSITESHRIFMLVVPQAALTAAADRVMTIASATSAFAGKLQIRITAAQASGTDMTASVAALADLNVKVADAKSQAQAALTELTGLKPDDGSQTVLQSNTAALKDARAKIKTAEQDLKTARKDAGTIVKALMGNLGRHD